MGNLELAIGDLPRGAGPAEKLTEALQAACEAAEVSKLMLTYLGQAQARHEPLDLSGALPPEPPHAPGRHAERHGPGY